MIKLKKFAPAVVLLGAMLTLVACKLTTSGAGPAPPPGGSNEYLFATSNNTVWSFSINTTTGALGTATSVSGPSLSQGIVANPGGTFLYVSDTYMNQVDVFSISSTGVLSQINGSPYTVGSAPTGNTTTQFAAGLAMDSAGKFLYATDLTNNDVAGFTTNSDGTLSVIANSPFPTSIEPANVVVDPSNQFVYVSDFGSGVLGGVSAFTLNSSSGALTPAPGFSPFTTVAFGEPLGLATIGQSLYVSENSATANSVASLSIIGGTGGLFPIAPALAAGSQPAGIAATPSGKYLYVANSGETSISGYSVDPTTGALTALNNSPFPATVAPWYLTIDPSGSFLYASNPNDNTITGFTINSSTGALTQFSGSATPAGTVPVSLTTATVQ